MVLLQFLLDPVLVAEDGCQDDHAFDFHIRQTEYETVELHHLLDPSNDWDFLDAL